MSGMANPQSLQCQIQIPDSEGGLLPSVGHKFTLSCDGVWGTPLKESAQAVFSDENENYSIVVLGVPESTENHFKMIVTSYRVGEHANKQITLTDGTTSVTTNPLSWTVASVLNKQEQPKPYPSEGPFYLDYPLWAWLILVMLVSTFLGAIAFIIYRQRKYKKLMDSLGQYATMLSPFSQYCKDMRSTARRLGGADKSVSPPDIIKQVDKDFRHYLIRELMVPALQVSDRELLRFIRKEHRSLYENCAQDMRRLLSELSRAQRDSTKVQAKDCEDLLFLSRKVSEKIYGLRRKSL